MSESSGLVCAGCGQDSGRLEVHTLTAEVYDSDLERVGDSVVRVEVTVCEDCAFNVTVNCEVVRVRGGGGWRIAGQGSLGGSP